MPAHAVDRRPEPVAVDAVDALGALELEQPRAAGRRRVDVDGARVARRLAVLRVEHEIELLERGMTERLLARRDREGRVALGLDHALEVVDRVRRRPVANDLDVALAAHVDVRVLRPRAAAAVRRRRRGATPSLVVALRDRPRAHEPVRRVARAERGRRVDAARLEHKLYVVARLVRAPVHAQHDRAERLVLLEANVPHAVTAVALRDEGGIRVEAPRVRAKVLGAAAGLAGVPLEFEQRGRDVLRVRRRAGRRRAGRRRAGCNGGGDGGLGLAEQDGPALARLLEDVEARDLDAERIARAVDDVDHVARDPELGLERGGHLGERRRARRRVDDDDSARLDDDRARARRRVLCDDRARYDRRRGRVDRLDKLAPLPVAHLERDVLRALVAAAGAALRRGARAVAQQQPRALGAAVVRRLLERRDRPRRLAAALDVRARLALEQERDDLGVAVARGAVERGVVAVREAAVDGRAALDEALHLSEVAVPRGGRELVAQRGHGLGSWSETMQWIDRLQHL